MAVNLTPVDVPPDLSALLEARSDDAEHWLAAVETGTRVEGDSRRPWAWFCVSDRRAVLVCATQSEVEPLWREFDADHLPRCLPSRVGRDRFEVDGELIFLGGLRGAAGLRWAAELASLRRGARLVEAGKQLQSRGLAEQARALYCAVEDPELHAEVARHLAVLDGATLAVHRYAEAVAPDVQAYVTLCVGSDHTLAVLETSTQCPQTGADWVFVATTRRAWLTSAVPDGRAADQPLKTVRLKVVSEVGRDPVTAGDVAWRATLANEERYHELAAITAMASTPRLVEMARLHKIHGEGGRAIQLLAVALDAEPVARLEMLRALCRGAGIHGKLARRIIDEEDAGSLARVLGDWEFPLQVTEQIVTACLVADQNRASSWTLPLQRRVFSHREPTAKEPTSAIAMRLSHARSLHNGGADDEARDHLQTVLAELPAESLADLVPAADSDSARGLRVSAWELMAQAGGLQAATVALAQLEPLCVPRALALAALADGPAAVLARARSWSELLTGDLEPAPAATFTPPPPAAAALLEHPLVARSAVWERVQAFVATQAIPDTAALRAYCQPLGRSSSATAVHALADATFFLGLPTVHAYVSRGDRRRGVRAFDGDPPFLLVGADHIDGDGDVDLTEAELRFAICAEAAHVRLGHVRITSAELWTGVWDKSWSVADFALALTPAKLLEKPIGAIGKGLPYLQKLGLGSVQDAVDYAGRVAGKLRPGASATGSESVGPEHRELLGVARALQLSADRAGLVFCGDIRAAVRAIFLTNPALIPVLAMAERHGLATTLDRRDDGGERMYEELAIRLGALGSFWMSEEFDALRLHG